MSDIKSRKVMRAIWGLIWLLLYRPSPRVFHGWRRCLLKLLGARVGKGSHIYPAVRIWAPWNLIIEENVGVANGVEIYNVDKVCIGRGAVISQGAYLCTASHDYRKSSFPLMTRPIFIEREAWIASRAIVHMGVTVKEGCVVGAGSVVTKDLPAWSVCAGNPCRVIKKYEKNDH